MRKRKIEAIIQRLGLPETVAADLRAANDRLRAERKVAKKAAKAGKSAPAIAHPEGAVFDHRLDRPGADEGSEQSS